MEEGKAFSHAVSRTLVAFLNYKEEEVENRFAYAGEQYDKEINLYYLRARFYNPVIGRFIQEDTYLGDGLNLYDYCHGNPVGYVDPSGHVCDKKTEILAEFEKRGLSAEDAKTLYDKYKTTGYDIDKIYAQVVINGGSLEIKNFEAMANAGPSCIQPYEVSTYSEYNKRRAVGSGLEGHEVWQHANLNENGYATTRCSTEISKDNPVIALPHKEHVEVNRAQREFNARTQTPSVNIACNSDIIKNQENIPKSCAKKVTSNAEKHYENVKKGNYN